MIASQNDLRLTRGVQKRLNETIRTRKLSSLHSGVLEMFDYLSSKDISEREWAIKAKHAFSARSDRRLKGVFTFFELDPDDPWAWRQLAGHWAHVLFGSSRTGRPSAWSDQRYCELLREVHRRKRCNMSRQPSEREICGHIARDKKRPAYFRKAGASGLRKALRQARSEKHNGVLRHLIEIGTDRKLAHAEARDLAIKFIEQLEDDESRA